MSFLLLFFPFLLFAQEPIGLEEAIELALKRSPSLRAQRQAIQEAEYQRKAALARFFPKVDTTYTYIRLDEAPKAVIPPLTGKTIPGGELVVTDYFSRKAGTRDNYSLEVTVTQPLYTGGALRNGYLLAKLGVDKARLEYETARLDLILKVKEAYYGVLVAKKMVEVAQKALDALREHHRIAQAFFEQGMIPKNDLLQVEVELAQREKDLISAQKGLEVAKAYFNTLLRNPLEQGVVLKERLVKVPFEGSLQGCIHLALEKRPEVKLARLAVEAARREAKVALSGLLPQISLVFNYERQGDDPSVSGSPYNPDEDSWNVMAVAQWRIWDFGETYFGYKGKEARVLKAEHTLREILDNIRLEVKEAYLALWEAEKAIEVSEKVLEQAEENFRANEERYRVQVATSSDVLDALAMLTRARANYWTSLADHNIALARLKRAMGVER